MLLGRFYGTIYKVSSILVLCFFTFHPVEEVIKGHKSTCDCTIRVLIYFALLCLLLHSLGDGWLVYAVQCRLVSKCLTGLVEHLRLWFGHEVCDGATNMFRCA